MNIPQIENLNQENLYSTQFDAHERLKILYNISKLLSEFKNIEETFPEILSFASEGFSLSTAVLIEHWAQIPQTTIWKSEDASEDDVKRAVTNSREAFSSMIGNSATEAQALQDQSPKKINIERTGKTQTKKTVTPDKYIVLPLIIDRLPAFGVLQLQGAVLMTEDDLQFAEAIADLLSVALDRFYKTQQEKEYQILQAEVSASKVQGLENERELREDFITLLTHDLRTPMSAALMSAQLILRKSENSQASQTMATRIVNNMHRADQMITNLLDANLIKSGEKLPLSLEHFNLTALVKETVEELTTLHGDNFIFEETEKIEGEWDRKGIRRVIENLCNNAIKYGALNEFVTVTLHKIGEHVQLSVMNRGNEISLEDQKLLFKKFHRTQDAQSGNKRGWGIGLTLVQGVAEAHGGNVKVSSDNEKGTIFKVTLPIEGRVVH